MEIRHPLSIDNKILCKEVNTNIQLPLSDWMNKTYIRSGFDVRYYQLESSTMTITCEVKDGFGMISKSEKNLTIVNTPKSNLFNITYALSKYKTKDKYELDDLLMRSEFLKSLGIDIYKDIKPEINRTTIINSLDYSKFDVLEPVCIQNFCNFRGFCSDRIDIYMYCICDIGYVGNRCQVDKEGYTKLAIEYQNLFNSIVAIRN